MSRAILASIFTWSLWCLIGLGEPAALAVAQAASADAPYEVMLSAEVAEKLLVKRVAPVWPRDLQEVTGTVVLHADIDKRGKVVNLKVLSGPSMLRGAAVDAVRNWRYKPYVIKGEPVDFETTVAVPFHH